MQACQCRATDRFVYVNCVGTFGISSALEWWQRHFGSILRAVHYLLGARRPIEMLAFSDDLESLAPGDKGRVSLVLTLCIFCVFDVPFQVKKTRGGNIVEWIGLECDYARSMVGLTARRASWLIDWCDSVIERGRSHPFARSGGGPGKVGLRGHGPLLGEALPWARSTRGPARSPRPTPRR